MFRAVIICIFANAFGKVKTMYFSDFEKENNDFVIVFNGRKGCFKHPFLFIYY